MEDVFGTTIMAIKSLAPDLRFTISAATDEDGTVVNGVDWNSLVIAESCAGMSLPPLEQIEQRRQEIVAAAPLRLLREKRNLLLAETDWWALPDRRMTAEQIEYRQALRDITTVYSSLQDVVWPTKPA